jgi:hypothetical protein
MSTVTQPAPTAPALPTPKCATTKILTPTVAIIGPVRFGFLNVFEPRINKLRAAERQKIGLPPEKEFSVRVMIPKNEPENCPDPNGILEDIRTMLAAGLVKKFREIPRKWETCLLDGDVETNNEGNPAQPGYWFFGARAEETDKPVLLDKHRRREVDKAQWVSGDWGYIKISFFGYDHEGKKGGSAYLKAVQFVTKGIPLGSDQDPEATAGEFDEFGEVPADDPDAGFLG